MTQDKQEPKKQVKDLIRTHWAWEADSETAKELAGRIDALYQTLLAALQQRVKELEEEARTSATEMFALKMTLTNRVAQIAALESQLKSQPVRGWEETVLKESEQRDVCLKRMGIYANSPGSYEQDQCLLKVQAELTWRKALASQKGEKK